MVIFDRIGRDSDCSFINSSSEKNLVQIREAPLAKLTEMHNPWLRREESFKNLSLKSKTWLLPSVWCSNTNLHSCHYNSWLAAYSEKNFCVTPGCECSVLHTVPTMQWNEKWTFFYLTHPGPLDGLFTKLEVIQRVSREKNAWHNPNPPNSN